MTRNNPGEYGVDAPGALYGLAVPGAVLLVGGIVWIIVGGTPWGGVPVFVGLYMLASAASFLYTTRRGKFAVWAGIIDGLALRGGERVLDMGCGRGMVLVQVARRLESGAATGLDLWRTQDQSGNAEAVTRANARAAGVSDRVELSTGDMTEMPYDDGAFDVVVSSLAVHNIPGPEGRRRAVAEAARVLRPGGRLAIADFRHIGAYAEVLTELGGTDTATRGLGWRFWYGGPWTGTHLLTATKPVE
jgi:SAM-dependent methyltransferase